MKSECSIDALEQIDYLIGSKETLRENLNYFKINKPFNSYVKSFVNAFSKSLMSSSVARQYPDLVALAFWMRKANIEKIESQFISNEELRLPVGRVLHFAPSNVDTIFIYSLFLSLLAGNSNLVRVSGKDSEKNKILIDLINELLCEFEYIKRSLVIVTYQHSDFITSYLCSIFEMRMIWGGDETVKKISSYPMAPSSTELKFTDKYSMCLLNAEELTNLSSNSYNELVKKFVNDSYWFAQQGCSSPRSIIWLNGSEHQADINGFWAAVEVVSKEFFNEDISLADVMNKMVSSYFTAIEAENITVRRHGHMLTRIQFNDMNSHKCARDYHAGAGLFYECHVNNLLEAQLLFDRKVQTLSYFGFDKNLIKDVCAEANIFPDRVVPVGTALDFSVKWDGFNLLNSLTRNIDFR